MHKLFGGGGNDIFKGGLVSYLESPEAVTVDLERPRATGEGRDELRNVAAVYGSEFDDVMYGSSGDDRLYAMGGGDELDGRKGEDVLDGGTGVDTCANGETEQSCES